MKTTALNKKKQKKNTVTGRLAASFWQHHRVMGKKC